MYAYIFFPLGILLPLYIYKKYTRPTFLYIHENNQHVLKYEYGKNGKRNVNDLITIVETSCKDYDIYDDTKNKCILVYSNDRFDFDDLKNKCYIVTKNQMNDL